MIFAVAAVVVGVMLLVLALIAFQRGSQVQQARGSEGVDADVAERTKTYWAAMRGFEEEAKTNLKDRRLGKYPVNESGQFDFRSFSNADFESLARFHFESGKVRSDVVAKIAALPILGVDPELISLKIELCEHWKAEAQIDGAFMDLVNALHEQKANFTSDDAYALRAIAALAGQPGLEEKYKAHQGWIDSRAAKWKQAQEHAEQLFDRIQRREHEIQALLTSKYRAEFK